jgi:GAF domain-containing protein
MVKGIPSKKARLIQQFEEKSSQLALVNRLTEIISSSLDISEVYEGFADELRETIDVDWATVAEIEENKLRFIALSAKLGSAWELGEVIPLRGTATEWVAQNKRSLVEPDLAKQKQFWTGEFHLRQGIKSIIYLPLVAKNEVFATLIIGSHRPNAYGKRELELLEHVAAQIAPSIQNARLFQKTEAQRKLLSSISQLTQVICSTPEIGEVYQTFAQELKKLIDFDRLSIGLIEGDKVRFLDVASDIATDLAPRITYPLKGSVAEWAKEHRRTNIETDFVQKRQFPIDEIHLKGSLRSAIRVPLFARDDVFGTINLTSSKPNAYGDEAREILEQLSAQVAGAIENARLYQLERERRLRLEAEIQSLQSVIAEMKSLA